MAAEADGKLQREFAIAGWNGMMDDLKRILADHPEAVHWADPNGGMTALHGAAGQCHTNVIQFLLAAGTDVNARDHKGETPLMYGAGNGGKTHIQALLDGGADVTLLDNKGHDVLYHTSDLLQQPQNADIIRRHAQLLEQKRLQEEETRRQADIDGAAAHMRDGSAVAVRVGKPLRLKGPG